MEGKAGELREVMGEMTGRDVDGFADAGTSRLDTGQRNGFQGFTSIKIGQEIKKATCRAAGWPGCFSAESGLSGSVSHVFAQFGNSNGGDEGVA